MGVAKHFCILRTAEIQQISIKPEFECKIFRRIEGHKNKNRNRNIDGYIAAY
jgi:hypothetical protein